MGLSMAVLSILARPASMQYTFLENKTLYNHAINRRNNINYFDQTT
tara:strand:+ start:1287 stop:1424 length:138 start_codon:yes stop_codon:yes gene_type:complete